MATRSATRGACASFVGLQYAPVLHLKGQGGHARGVVPTESPGPASRLTMKTRMKSNDLFCSLNERNQRKFLFSSGSKDIPRSLKPKMRGLWNAISLRLRVPARALTVEEVLRRAASDPVAWRLIAGAVVVKELRQQVHGERAHERVRNGWAMPGLATSTRLHRCFLVTTGAQKPPVRVSKQPVGGSW